MNPTVIRSALKITAAYVRNARGGFLLATQHLPLTELSKHIASADQILQTSALGVINALLLMAPTRGQRTEIFVALESQNIIGSLADPVRRSQVSDVLAHELYVLQTLWLGRLQDRRGSFYSDGDKVKSWRTRFKGQ